MSFKKNILKKHGMKQEKVTGSFIEDAPSVAGLRCVRGVPFVEPIEARKKTVIELDDVSFSSMMADTQTVLIKNKSGSQRMTFELRKVEKGLPANGSSWICFGERTCRICGCTEDHACPGGCSWVEEDLCSACAKPKKMKAKRRKP